MSVEPIRVLVNGEASNAVATTDRGLLYGDGLFETIACVEGTLQFWQSHMQRLQSGCERLGIGNVDTDTLQEECLGLVDGVVRGVLKIIITRGTGGRGYRSPDNVTPTRIVQLHDWPEYPVTAQTEGVSTIICNTRLGQNPSLAGMKHLNRLEQVMARREWNDEVIREGLMLDNTGHVIEGTMSNVFLVSKGGLLTPDLTQCGVAGIMRAHVMGLAAQENMTVDVTAITLAELQLADEVFVCNSLIGIWPVRRVEDIAFEKGPLTTRLQARLARPNGDAIT
jgi:4-amino-4-deoxychorismate lyase